MEIWKDIEGYEGMYQVSHLGRIKSLERKIKYINRTCNFKERILKCWIDSDGYVCVDLTNENTKVKSKLKVHRLVSQTFIPNPENKPQVNHKDGNKKNNKLSNLEWCTHLENMRHAFKTGLIKR